MRFDPKNPRFNPQITHAHPEIVRKAGSFPYDNTDSGLTATKMKDAIDETVERVNDHSGRHEDGGPDEISVAGLSGELADPQPPKTHATSHEPGGSDAMAVDAAANVGSLRTLGTGATQAAAGNHAHAGGGGGGIGPLLITSEPAGSPLVFADLLQNSEGTDLLYASET